MNKATIQNSIHCVSERGTPTLSIVTLKWINGF